MQSSYHLRASATSVTRVTSIVCGGALVMALLSACGDPRPKTGGQVVAKVNGEEITVHQVKQEFSALAPQKQADRAETSRTVLNTLIDEQLLAATGKRHKLDRDPQVMQALDKARREILARATAEYLTAALPVPTKEEVADFYKSNPALFEKRRVYLLWQFTFERAAFGDAIRKQLEKAKSPGDIAALLRREKIAFREQPSVRTAEQFPMEVLPKITALSKSDVVVLNTPSEAAVLYAVDFVDQPATLEQATPIIERYLLSARKQKQVEARLKELRSTAKIEYVASAAQALTAAPGEPAHQQESGVGATPKVQQPVAASSDEPGVANDKADRHVGQGLLGTKK